VGGEPSELAEKALAKGQGLSELLHGILSKDDKRRYRGLRALVYDEWDRFAECSVARMRITATSPRT